MNSLHTQSGSMSDYTGDVADRLSSRADEALLGAKRVADGTARSVQAGLDGLRDSVPTAVSRAAAQAEDMTRRGIERARLAAEAAKHRATDLSDATVHRIQDEPVKAILIAAAVGAAATLLVQWLSRSRRQPY